MYERLVENDVRRPKDSAESSKRLADHTETFFVSPPTLRPQPRSTQPGATSGDRAGQHRLSPEQFVCRYGHSRGYTIESRGFRIGQG